MKKKTGRQNQLLNGPILIGQEPYLTAGCVCTLVIIKAKANLEHSPFYTWLHRHKKPPRLMTAHHD